MPSRLSASRTAAKIQNMRRRCGGGGLCSSGMPRPSGAGATRQRPLSCGICVGGTPTILYLSAGFGSIATAGGAQLLYVAAAEADRQVDTSVRAAQPSRARVLPDHAASEAIGRVRVGDSPDRAEMPPDGPARMSGRASDEFWDTTTRWGERSDRERS